MSFLTGSQLSSQLVYFIFVIVINRVKSQQMLRYFMFCLLMITGIIHTNAQEVSFTALAAERMGIEDRVQVQYVLKNAQNVQTLSPKNAELTKDFYIVGGPATSSGSQTTIINGKVSSSQSITLTYVLQPKRKGTLTIPKAYAHTSDGVEYESNSIRIEVVDGSVVAQRQAQDPFASNDPFDAFMRQRQRQMDAMRQRMQQQPQRGPQTQYGDVNIDEDIFIRVYVDKSKVYLGEQMTVSYKLYTRVPMRMGITKVPFLNGFWTEDFIMPEDQNKPVIEVIDGKRYQVFTLKKSAIFPQQTGNLVLDPAEAEGVARIAQEVRGGDPFFNDPRFNNFMMNDPYLQEFFRRVEYRDVEVHVKSKPIKIQVDSLPTANKPEHYTGAVGKFTVSSTVDKTELTTDDVLNLKVKIKGSGNIKLIEAPELNLPNGLTTYDPAIEDTITGRTTTISGTKTITYAVTPTTPGDYEIPAINFTYFDPKTSSYITTTTKPVKIKVAPGKNYKPDALENVALTDIHTINTSPFGKLKPGSKPIVLSVGYWSMYALPLLALFGVLAWKRREEELAKDTISLKRRKANKIALKRLATANKLLQKNERTLFYEEVSKAIWLYLSDKLNIPLSSLSKDNVWDALKDKNIPEDLQKQLSHVMEDCEMALYSGAGGNQQMNQTYKVAVDIISKLEESFKA